MTSMYRGSVDAFYEESRTARTELDALLQSYRSNTTTVLALATGAATFFGFSSSPKGAWFVAALVAYGIAAGLAATLFWPVDWKMNIANGMGDTLKQDNAQQLTTIKVRFDLGVGHQLAFQANTEKIVGALGVARRFTGLVVATSLVVIFAGINVLVADAPAPSVTRVQIVEE